ncbi:hypothetical protein VL10_23990 [Leclercia adecarboxylata]|nr:hypothetical protein VL10_23990 [Leclercia adecarboxylata]KMN66742.1 hypothetical protein VK95_04430 [Leclercia sp. LK8]
MPILPSLKLTPSLCIDHNAEIRSLIKHNQLECDFLHGTRSSTLAKMMSKDIDDAVKGCLLSQRMMRDYLHQSPQSGCYLLSGIDGLAERGGDTVSTVSKDEGKVAVHYARISSTRLPDSFPLIFGIKNDKNLSITEVIVQDDYLEEIFIDHTVKNKIPPQNITAILAPVNEANALRELCFNNTLSHTKIIEYPHITSDD